MVEALLYTKRPKVFRKNIEVRLIFYALRPSIKSKAN